MTKSGKYIILTLLLTFSCAGNSKKEIQIETNEEEGLEIEMPEEKRETKTLADFRILKYVCFARRDYGLDAKTSPEVTAPKAFDFYFGDSIAVVGDTGDWLEVLDIPWNRMIDKPADTMSVRVGYIRKDELGDIEYLKLPFEDLIVYYTSDDYETTKSLTNTDILQLEEITRETFYEKKKTILIDFQKENADAVKSDHLLKIVCGDTCLIFEDVDPKESLEGMREYTYLGMWEELGIHAVFKSGFEHLQSYLFDRDTGELLSISNYFPVVSPDGRYIIDIWGNPYDEEAEFVLKKRNETGKIEDLHAFYFTKWVPALANYGSFDDYFFGGDSCLYIRIISAKLAGTGINENEMIWQYIRICFNF